MHSHSFQDTYLKLHRHVNDSPKNVNSTCIQSFQDTELKLHRYTYVNDSPGQVVEGMTILWYPRGLRNKGLITQKTLIQPAFAQFSRYRAETSQVRHCLPGTGRGGVDDSMVSKGLRNKELITQKTLIHMHSHSFQDTELKLCRSYSG